VLYGRHDICNKLIHHNEKLRVFCWEVKSVYIDIPIFSDRKPCHVSPFTDYFKKPTTVQSESSLTPLSGPPTYLFILL